MTGDPKAVVERARAAIARYDRPDLDDRLAAARARLLDERTRVLVVGEFKQGKSLLVNGLVGAPVCPTFDDVATAVPTVVRYAEALDVAVVRPDGERVGIGGDELADHVCEQGNPGNREGWSHAEVGLPRPVLKGGLEIVDTPGVGGITLQTAEGAKVVLSSTGCQFTNGQGATVQLTGPQVSVNNGALDVT